jgi:hypothetical protein
MGQIKSKQKKEIVFWCLAYLLSHPLSFLLDIGHEKGVIPPPQNTTSVDVFILPKCHSAKSFSPICASVLVMLEEKIECCTIKQKELAQQFLLVGREY